MRKPAVFDSHPMPYETRPLRAVCEYVVDGDTFDVLVDEGLYDYAYVAIRLRDFNAPELRSTVEGERTHAEQAREFLTGLLLGTPVKLVTYRDRMTFDRFVADVWYWRRDAWVSVAEEMRANGFERRESY